MAATSSRKERYDAYIDSDAWRAKRGPALERAEHRCQVCNADKHLDVHHRTYERLGNEKPGDLTVLCRSCHELFHENRHLKSASKSKPRKRKGSTAKKEAWKRRMAEDGFNWCSKCHKRMTTKGMCGPCRKHGATVKLGTRKTTRKYDFS